MVDKISSRGAGFTDDSILEKILNILVALNIIVILDITLKLY